MRYSLLPDVWKGVVSMGVYIRGMEMPKSCGECKAFVCYRQWAGDVGDCFCGITKNDAKAKKKNADCPLVPVPPHGRLRRRIVYRGEVYNALESARINALDGILTDRYKDGFHDGLKKALEILANEVKDAPTIIPASEEGE